MAGQFQVAHSAIIAGAAILAAGPYGCAESAGAETFPYFSTAIAYNLVQAQNGCTANRLSGLGVLDSGTLLRRASTLADKGKIDPLSGLKRGRVYLYAGANDRTVVKPVVEAARNFYLAAGVPAENVEFDFRSVGGHAFLTADKGAACDRSLSPYVDNCGYDQAGAILRFIYGPLAPKGTARPENFITFAQGGYAAPDATLAEEGVVYVPSACRAEAGCRVHIVFHGCEQSRALVGDAEGPRSSRRSARCRGNFLTSSYTVPARATSGLCAAPILVALFGGQHRVDALLLHHDDQEPCWLRRARVAPSGVHIVRAFVESLSWRQGNLLAAPDLLDDRSFQHVDEGVRIVPMNVLHSSRRIFDGEHQHLLSRYVSEILLHDGDHNWLGCGLRERAAEGQDGGK
jgi:hypothetical protein